MRLLVLLLFLFSLSSSNFVYAGQKKLAANPYEHSNNTGSVMSINDWFAQYDQIRRQAQLSPQEKQESDRIMSRGLSIFMPGQDKLLAQNILKILVQRYQIACQQINSLPIHPATEQLHRGYAQYFFDALHLFSDYLRLQEDLMAVDPSTGQPIASGLMERKENLSQLDQNNKALDYRLRSQFGIAPYQY